MQKKKKTTLTFTKVSNNVQRLHLRSSSEHGLCQVVSRVQNKGEGRPRDLSAATEPCSMAHIANQNTIRTVYLSSITVELILFHVFQRQHLPEHSLPELWDALGAHSTVNPTTQYNFSSLQSYSRTMSGLRSGHYLSSICLQCFYLKCQCK